MDEVDLELADYPDDGEDLDLDDIFIEDDPMVKMGTWEEVEQLLNKPTAQLCDYAVAYKDGTFRLWPGQPCHMNLGSALHTQLKDTYDAYDGAVVKKDRVAKGIYLGLRLPSKYATGMDVEDDINRESHKEGNTAYAWQFEQQQAGLGTSQDDKTAVAYWEYLFDLQESPFKKAIINYPSYIYNKKEEVIGVYLEVDDSIDAQIFVAMCMASRIPWQSLGHLRVYQKMRDEGYSEVESFWVAAHIRFIADEKHVAFRTVTGHFAFAPYDTMISIDWMKGATPHTRGIHITKDRYESVAEIWDLNKQKLNKTYVQITKQGIEKCKLYPILSIDEKYNGVFAKRFKKSEGTHHQGGTCGTWDVVSKKLKESYTQWSQD
jgi:hypothetical protein